jgi:hypothetical protein
MPRRKRDELRWLLEPPEPGQVHLYFDVAEGTELTPEATAALEALVRALAEPEVAGYATSGETCSISCGSGYKVVPCAAKESCGKGYSCKITFSAL